MSKEEDYAKVLKLISELPVPAGAGANSTEINLITAVYQAKLVLVKTLSEKAQNAYVALQEIHHLNECQEDFAEDVRKQFQCVYDLIAAVKKQEGEKECSST
tara:strand:- start:9170 stop:9475 length:306 start_codon:yes stop_codon:yes gene_type:complete